MASGAKIIVSPLGVKGKLGYKDIPQAQAVTPPPITGRKRFAIMEYRNGIYQGDFNSSGEREGLGVYIWDSGELYFGEWDKDFICGQGILYFPCGGYLHGFFKNNKVHGFARLLFPNSDVYNGEWSEGKLNGKCFKQFVERCCWLVCEYKGGVFKSCTNQGKGEIPNKFLKSPLVDFNVLANRASNDDNINWFGFEYKCINFSDGGKYLGVAKNDLPNGLGIFHYSDGKTDLGFYKDGVLEGFGRLNFLNGDLYDGMMKDGLFEGQGVFYQKETNKWIYGSFNSNRCNEVADMGEGLPREIMEFIKSEQHRTSKYYRDSAVPSDVFVIPKMSEETSRQKSQMKSPSQSSTKKTSNTKDTSQQQKKIPTKLIDKQETSIGSSKNGGKRTQGSQDSKQKKVSTSTMSSVLTEVSQNISTGSHISNNLISPKHLGANKQSSFLNATNVSNSIKTERNQSITSNADDNHALPSSRSGVEDQSLFPVNKQSFMGQVQKINESNTSINALIQKPNDSNFLPRMSAWSSSSCCLCPDCIPPKAENANINKLHRDSFYSPGRIESAAMNSSSSAAENMKLCTLKRSENYFGSPKEKLETPFKEESNMSSHKQSSFVNGNQLSAKSEICTCSDCLQNFTQRLQKSIERNPSKKALFQNTSQISASNLVQNSNQTCDCKECAMRGGLKSDISQISSHSEVSAYIQSNIKSPSSLLKQNCPQISYVAPQSFSIQQNSYPNVHAPFEISSNFGANLDLGSSRQPAFRDEQSYSNIISGEPKISSQVLLDKSLRMVHSPTTRPTDFYIQPLNPPVESAVTGRREFEASSLDQKNSFVSRSEASSVTSNYSYTTIHNSSAEFSRSIYLNERDRGMGTMGDAMLSRRPADQTTGFTQSPELSAIGKITKKVPGMIVSKGEIRESQERMEEKVMNLIQQKAMDSKEDLYLKATVSKLENQTDTIAKTLESLKLQLSEESNPKNAPAVTKGMANIGIQGNNNSMMSCDFLLSRTEMNITGINNFHNKTNITISEPKPIDTSNITLVDKSSTPLLAMSFTKKDNDDRLGQLPGIFQSGEPGLSHNDNSFSSINLSNILPGPTLINSVGNPSSNMHAIGKPPIYPKFFSSEKKDDFSLNSPFCKDDIKELASTPKETMKKDPDPGLNIKLQPGSEVEKFKTSDFQTVLFPEHTIVGGDSSNHFNNLSGQFIDMNKSSLMQQPLISCSFSDLSPIRNTAHELNNNSLLLPSNEQGCPVNSSSPFLGGGTLDLGPKQNYEIVQKYGIGIEKIDERLEEQNESVFVGDINQGAKTPTLNVINTGKLKAEEIIGTSSLKSRENIGVNFNNFLPSNKGYDLDSQIAFQHEEVRNLYKKFKPQGLAETEFIIRSKLSLAEQMSTEPSRCWDRIPEGSADTQLQLNTLQLNSLTREVSCNYPCKEIKELKENGYNYN